MNTIEQQADDANRRISSFINRSAGQHLRAIGIKPHATGCVQHCNDGNDCTCTSLKCVELPSEWDNVYVGSNVWFAEPEPKETWDAIAMYVFVAITSVASIAIVAGLAGWVYGVTQ